MDYTETKTANQLYKESGSPLTFSDWIAIEKEKGYFIKNDSLSSLLEEIKSSSDDDSVSQPKKVLGLSKPIIIISATIIIAAIGYKVYQTYKNK